MPTEISDIRIYKTSGSEKLRAYATVTLGGEFAIHGVKVMEREDGDLWVSMPRQKRSFDGTWIDVFHPITKGSRERLYSAVLEAYEKSISEGEKQTKPPTKKLKPEKVKDKAKKPKKEKIDE
jgi:stage V sporulation protein G